MLFVSRLRLSGRDSDTLNIAHVCGLQNIISRTPRQALSCWIAGGKAVMPRFVLFACFSRTDWLGELPAKTPSLLWTTGRLNRRRRTHIDMSTQVHFTTGFGVVFTLFLRRRLPVTALLVIWYSSGQGKALLAAEFQWRR